LRIEVAPGGPADEAGIKNGDLIVSVNGRVIAGLDDLHQILSGLRSSGQLLVTVLRQERLVEMPIELRLGE